MSESRDRRFNRMAAQNKSVQEMIAMSSEVAKEALRFKQQFESAAKAKKDLEQKLEEHREMCSHLQTLVDELQNELLMDKQTIASMQQAQFIMVTKLNAAELKNDQLQDQVSQLTELLEQYAGASGVPPQ